MSPAGPRQPGGPSDDPHPGGPPREVIESAKALFRPKGRELAVLTYDSLVDSDDEAADHHLRFEHPAVVVELDVCAEAGATHLAGRAEPGVARVVLHLRDADLALISWATDGQFEFDSVRHGLIRLSLERQEPGPAVWTDWFRV